MTRKLLDTDSGNTRKTQPVQRPSSGGRILLWLLILILLLAFGTVVTIITRKPGFLGLIQIADSHQTESAIQGTMLALQATDQQNQQRDLDLLNTQAALDNFSSRLAQTETQQTVNNNSTLTAVALANEAQATQAALNFAGTQAALQQISTQIQLEFEATQTALSGSFATIEAAGNHPQQNVLILNGDFIRGVETSGGQFPVSSPSWAISDTGALVAQTDNATALTQQTMFVNGYTLNIRFTIPSVPAVYDGLFGIDDNGKGYALRLYYNGTQVEKAALFAIDSHDFGNETGLVIDENTALNIASGLGLSGSEFSLEINV
ncbi:MAG TPA: hypothetical protein VHL11_00585, partial [Phototrophicaceae bacterium]|nr:hypothetical protein [Phototrophicaceae bacterium]